MEISISSVILDIMMGVWMFAQQWYASIGLGWKIVLTTVLILFFVLAILELILGIIRAIQAFGRLISPEDYNTNDSR